MSRRPRLRAEEARRRIELAAIELFAERDPDSVSLADVGARVETTPQAVHYHYGSKAALREASLTRLIALITEALDALAHDLPSLTLSSLTDRAFQLAQDHPVAFRATLIELLRGDFADRLRHELRARQGSFFATATTQIVEAQRAGIVRPDASADLFGVAASLLLLITIGGSPDALPITPDNAHTVRARIREACRMILVSLLVEPDPLLR
ncbi:MAG: TetR/AcrR family transcriptional regulator [Myxococcales bacterium]|nr:TetR/AcrR family transcriptional regulator [Myxococcales bacterium]